MKVSLYRSVVEKTPTGETIRPPVTRIPVNVPYIVDNLWEWTRPEEFPSRRTSVFASLSFDIAKRRNLENGNIYVVEPIGTYTLAQLVNYEDSKNHPEVFSLRDKIFELISPEWAGSSLEQKREVGKLFIPCLSKPEMEELFTSSTFLPTIKDEIKAVVRYWNDVELVNINQGFKNDTGEVFMSVPYGYRLRKPG